MTAEKIAELKRWLVIAQQPYNPRYKAAKRDAQAMVTRFVPDLISALEAAQAERDALQGESAYVTHQLEWVEQNGDTYTKSALMDFIRRTLNAINHTSEIKEAVAARDARLKNEGAAEWLENAAREGVYYERSSEGMLEDAAELRRKGGE